MVNPFMTVSNAISQQAAGN